MEKMKNLTIMNVNLQDQMTRSQLPKWKLERLTNYLQENKTSIVTFQHMTTEVLAKLQQDLKEYQCVASARAYEYYPSEINNVILIHQSIPVLAAKIKTLPTLDSTDTCNMALFMNEQTPMLIANTTLTKTGSFIAKADKLRALRQTILQHQPTEEENMILAGDFETSLDLALNKFMTNENLQDVATEVSPSHLLFPSTLEVDTPLQSGIQYTKTPASIVATAHYQGK